MDSDDEEQAALLPSNTREEMDGKDLVKHAENAQSEPPLHITASEIRHGDRALALIGDERMQLTDEDNGHILRKTDAYILPILVWVYFLQVLDKTTLGYGAVFGLQKDAKLTGSQYSLIGSISPIAQLIWQPISSFLVVKVPHRILMPTLVLGWGISQASMAACNDYSGLMATRFFLGLFEAGCLPLFSVITSHWYRRSEQPVRVAAWYSMNGTANLAAAALSYGLGQVKSESLYPWQM
jgi:MFS family permease